MSTAQHSIAPKSSLARPPANRQTVTLDSLALFDAEVSVATTYHHAFPGDREQPAEIAGYTVDAVYLRGADITDLLGELEREIIEDQINGRD